MRRPRPLPLLQPRKPSALWPCSPSSTGVGGVALIVVLRRRPSPGSASASASVLCVSCKAEPAARCVCGAARAIMFAFPPASMLLTAGGVLLQSGKPFASRAQRGWRSASHILLLLFLVVSLRVYGSQAALAARAGQPLCIVCNDRVATKKSEPHGWKPVCEVCVPEVAEKPADNANADEPATATVV